MEKLVYICSKGSLNVKLSVKPFNVVLHDDEEKLSPNGNWTLPKSDVASMPELVRDVFAAAMSASLKATRATSTNKRITFTRHTLLLSVDGRRLLPVDDVSAESLEVKTLFDIVYGYDPNPQGKGRFAEIYDLLQLEDQPDEPVTLPKIRTVTKCEIINGKAIETQEQEPYDEPQFDELPVEDGQGNPLREPDIQQSHPISGEPLFDGQGNPVMIPGPQRIYREPRMTPGAKVSQADKDRLIELQARGL